MRDQITAPTALVKAVKQGERIKGKMSKVKTPDTPGRHIKRFSMALAAYVCIALLLIGSVSFLPRFLDNSPAGTQPNTPEPEPTITEAEMQALLDAGGTYADLVERIGERHREAPTGLTIYEWDLANGKILIVLFNVSKGTDPENLRIVYFRFSDRSMTGQPIDPDSPEPAPSITEAEMDALIANGCTYADLIVRLGHPDTNRTFGICLPTCMPVWKLADGRELVVFFVEPTLSPDADDLIDRYAFYTSESVSPVDYSPSGFYNTLCGDSDMIVTSEMRSGAWHLESVYERDGNKVKETIDAGDGERVTYYVDDWQSIVNMYVIGNGWEMFTVIGGDLDVLFTDDHFTLQDDRYVATEAFLAECLENGKADCAAGFEYFVEWYGENPTYEIYFDYKDGAQIFNFRFFAEDGELVHEMVITLTIGDVTVELPQEAN